MLLKVTVREVCKTLVVLFLWGAIMVESMPLKCDFYKQVLLPVFKLTEVQKVNTVIF